ncbi:unnamed protein product [Pseudo-nitzschia multistriata]|uniref:Mpv17/PMP22 family protein n=1 Tax=Pseudo-nitzschia multistriata TaxID=183589 RepID=A0A448ZR03_9STRA|nr:unnamed protein product [Pseudo-nitzschia multistriata]
MMAVRHRAVALGGKRMAASKAPVPFRSPILRGSGGGFSTSASPPPPASFFGRMWASYTEALIARPLLVKGGAASLIFLVSDSATQRLMNGPEAEWDGSRALSGAGFGVVATCWLHYWWGFLEVVVNKRLPTGAYGQNKFVNALGKVVADQLVGAPLYIYSYYCVTHFGKEWMAIREGAAGTDDDDTGPDGGEAAEPSGDSLSSAVSLMKDTSDRALEMLPDTLLRHWTLWPIVHTLNFYYNPIHHRVLVQNIVLIFWSGYLSHLNNGGLDLVTPEKEVDMVVEKHQAEKRA